MPIFRRGEEVAAFRILHSSLLAISAGRQALPQLLPLAVSKNTDNPYLYL
jgi:hypothetical protein